MADDDSPWRNVLKRYFPDFLAFFFHEAHAGIDWTLGYSELDKELQKVVRDATLGRCWTDSLVRVTALGGYTGTVAVNRLGTNPTGRARGSVVGRRPGFLRGKAHALCCQL